MTRKPPSSKDAQIKIKGDTMRNIFMLGIALLFCVSAQAQSEQIVVNLSANQSVQLLFNGSGGEIGLLVGGISATVTEMACTNPIPTTGTFADLCTNSSGTAVEPPLAQITASSNSGPIFSAPFTASSLYILAKAETGPSGSLSEFTQYFGPPQLPTFSINPIFVPVAGSKNCLALNPCTAGVPPVYNPTQPQAYALPAAVQAVFGTIFLPVNLIQGKATAFLVGAKVDNIANLPTSGLGLEIQVQFNGETLTSGFVSSMCSGTGGLNCWNPDGTSTAVVNPQSPYFTPPASGTIVASATVNPETSPNHIMEATEPIDITTHQSQTQLNVVPNISFSVFYVGIQSCGSLNCGTLSSFAYLPSIQQANVFMQATYPVSDGGIHATVSQTLIVGSSNSTIFGFDQDIAAVHNLMQTAGLNHAVGIVPPGYFAAHGLKGDLGKTPVGGSVSLVEVPYWVAVAHELGHQFTLVGQNADPSQPGNEEYHKNYLGNPASGFWVSSGAGVLVPNQLCFMGAGLPYSAVHHNIGARWIDPGHYNTLITAIPLAP